MTQVWVHDGCKDAHGIGEEVFLRNALPTGAVLTLTDADGHWQCVREAAAEKAKGAMTIKAEPHIFITGACGGGRPAACPVSRRYRGGCTPAWGSAE